MLATGEQRVDVVLLIEERKDEKHDLDRHRVQYRVRLECTDRSHRVDYGLGRLACRVVPLNAPDPFWHNT